MPFPTEPNSSTMKGIHNKDAFSLILRSIALESMSIAELIDSEARQLKTNFVQGDIKASAEEISSVSNSIQRLLADACRLEILLQHKLEYIHSFFNQPEISGTGSELPKVNTTNITGNKAGKVDNTIDNADKAVSTTADADKAVSATADADKAANTTADADNADNTTADVGNADNTTADVDNADNTQAVKSSFSFQCREVGIISGQTDTMYGGISILNARLFCENCNNDFDHLLYSIRKGDTMYIFKAFLKGIEVNNNTEGIYNIFVIKGIGAATIKVRTKKDINSLANFELCIWHKSGGISADHFSMAVSARNNSALSHRSGTVTAKESSLIIKPLLS